MTTKVATAIRHVERTKILDNRQARLDVWQSARGLWQQQRKDPLRYQQKIRTERHFSA